MVADSSSEWVPDGAEFALCLTHDVDRPYKTMQAPYYALKHGDLSHLDALVPGRNPWWLFEDIMDIEDEFEVRSAFYFLQEQHLFADRDPSEWLTPRYWIEHLGRYDVTSPDIVSLMRTLRENGWEVGLHGSYDAYDDPERLRYEKARLESALGTAVTGGRQHFLNLDVPTSWRHHADVGLRYDASLGSSSRYGFHHGYAPLRPFDDEFVVFPLTVMEKALPDPRDDFEAARVACEQLLQEARDNEAVMSALWHPRFYEESDFPGQRRLYRWLIERALELDGWVGPPRDLYRRFAATGDDWNGPNAVSRSQP